MNIKQIREKYPQYDDLSDKQLVDGLHGKFYSDIPINDFYSKVGFINEEAPAVPEAPKDDYLTSAAKKGLVGLKSNVAATQAAFLQNSLEKAKQQYGENFENAPEILKPQLEQAREKLGTAVEDIAKYATERKEIEQKHGVRPFTQEMRAWNSSEEFNAKPLYEQMKDIGSKFIENPSGAAGYIADIGLESLPSSAASIALAALARRAGAGAWGAAAAGGGGSMYMEFGNTYAELRDQGMSHDEAWNKAAVKSGIIGAFDAASFKTAGKTAEKVIDNIRKGAIKETAKSVSKETGKQAALGGAGEAFGSVAIGQPVSTIGVLEEMLGEVVGAPAEAVTTYKGKAAEARAAGVDQAKGKYTINEQGTLVPVAEAAPVTTATTPLTTQGELFTEQEAPLQVTPSERIGTTETGEQVIAPIADEAVKAQAERQAKVESQIADLQEQLKEAKTPETIADIRSQIASLQESIETPESKLSALRDEFDVLERQRVALQESHAAAPTLKEKGDIIERSRAIYEQQQAIESQIKDLRKQIGVQETARPGTPEAAPQGQATLEFEAPSVIDKDVARRFGFTPKATKILNQIDGLDMTKPEDRETFKDAIAKHERKGAKVDMQAVEDYLSNFEQPVEEAPSEPRPVSDVGTGGSQPSVSMLDQQQQPAEGVTTPDTTGLASDIGTTRGTIAGEGVQPSAQPDTLAAQAAPQVTPEVSQAAPVQAAPTAQAQPTIRQQKRQQRPQPKGFMAKFRDLQQAHKDNMLLPTLFGKLQNIFSFDDAFNNRMRVALTNAAKAGDATMEQAKTALLRISLSQTLFRAELARKFMEQGNLVYDKVTNRWHAVADEVNMEVFKAQVQAYADRNGIDVNTALEDFSDAYEANRVTDLFAKLDRTKGEITRTQAKVDSLRRNRQRTKAEEKELSIKSAHLKNLQDNLVMYSEQLQGFSRQEAQEGMQQFNANPEIQEGMKIWNTMRERTIQKLVDAGVKTEAQAEKWIDNSAYVPFQRVMSEEEANDLMVSRKGIREKMTDERFKGSMLEVNNVIGNMYQWMQWSTSRAISNQQLRVMKDQYRAALPEEVRDGRGKDSNTFTIYEDGVKKYFHVADPAIAQAFTGVQSIVFPGISAAMKYKNLFSHAITRMPLFPLAQLILKDTWEAMFTSGLKNPFGLLKQIPAEIIRTAKGTSEARQYMKETGVLSTHEYGVLTDANDVASKLHLEKPGAYRATMNMLDKWAALNDNVLRQAVFAQAKAEGLSDTEAAEKAVEIFNFRRMSGNPMLQFVSSVVPFYNAYAQVQRVTLKTLSGSGITPQERKEGLKVLATTSAKLAMLSMLYAMAVKDDEDYEKMNRIVRDSSFVVPGTGGFHIPIRTGLFAVPKMFGEYAYHIVADTAYVDKEMFYKAMSRAVKKQFEPPVGGIFVPPVALAMNHDPFMDREIVNATMRKYLPEEQFNKNTSEISKVMGKMSGISPLKLDYFFNAYLGSTMTLLALATNNSIAEARGIPRPEKPTKDFIASLPSMGGYITKEEATGAVADFYEAAKDTNQIMDTVKHIAPSRPEEARKLLEENRKNIAYTQGIGAALAGLNRKENAILNMPAERMNAEQKAVEIKKIQEDRAKLTKPIREVRKKLFE